MHNSSHQERPIQFIFRNINIRAKQNCGEKFENLKTHMAQF